MKHGRIYNMYCEPLLKNKSTWAIHKTKLLVSKKKKKKNNSDNAVPSAE